MLQGNRLKIKQTPQAADIHALIRYRRLSIRSTICALVTQMRARSLHIDQTSCRAYPSGIRTFALYYHGARDNSIFLPRKRLLGNSALEPCSGGSFLSEERRLTRHCTRKYARICRENPQLHSPNWFTKLSDIEIKTAESCFVLSATWVSNFSVMR